jgi:hypothetical protein
VATTGWNSLEVAKLAIAALTPLVVVGLGIVVSRAARRVEDVQWANRRLVDRRLELYDEMAGPLNDLFCFFKLVGHFRDIDPPTAIQKKREVDKAFYVNRFLMTDHFGVLYHEFINTCFKPWASVAHDAKMRASVARQRAERGREKWNPEWETLFVSDRAEVAADSEVEGRYESLMTQFAAECGVGTADVADGGTRGSAHPPAARGRVMGQAATNPQP